MMRSAGNRRLKSLASLLNLPQVARLFFALLGDPRVSAWLKVGAAAGVVYIFSPLDIIPDFTGFTGFGLLDDVIVTLLLMQVFIERSPTDVVLWHCERLRIDPEKLFVNIPQTIADSMEVVVGFVQRSGQSTAAASRVDAPQSVSTVPDQPSAAQRSAPDAPRVEMPAPEPEPVVPDSLRRYSAYNKEQR